MLIIFVLIRKIDEIIITFDIEILNYKGGFFIIPFIIFFSQFLAGLIPIFKETCNKNKESKNNRKYIGIELNIIFPYNIYFDKLIFNSKCNRNNPI